MSDWGSSRLGGGERHTGGKYPPRPKSEVALAVSTERSENCEAISLEGRSMRGGVPPVHIAIGEAFCRIGIVFNRRHAQTAFVNFRDAAEIAAPAGRKRGASAPVCVLLDSRHRLRPMSKPSRFM